MVQDPAAPVRTCAVRCLRSLVSVLREEFIDPNPEPVPGHRTLPSDALSSIRTPNPLRRFNAAEVNLFPLYVSPLLSKAMKDSEITVRLALAGRSVSCRFNRSFLICTISVWGSSLRLPSGS